MAECPNCGTVLDPDDAFCSECGTPRPKEAPPKRSRAGLFIGLGVVLAAAIIVGGIALIGGGEDDGGSTTDEVEIRAVTAAFYAAINAGDGEQACEQLSRKLLAKIRSDADGKATCAEIAAAFAEQGVEVPEPELRGLDVDGNLAVGVLVAPAHMKFRDGPSVPMIYVREADGWKFKKAPPSAIDA